MFKKNALLTLSGKIILNRVDLLRRCLNLNAAAESEIQVNKSKLETKQSEELFQLKAKFSDPKGLIDMLLRDYVNIDRSKTPRLEVQPSLNGTCRRCTHCNYRLHK